MQFVYDFVQSERSDGMFCDDIFGETPTGIRKSVSSMFYTFSSHKCSLFV